MSQSEDEEVNRREVAYRLFAAEFDDADYSYAESDEERAPNYVVTPTGARVNRVFVVGVLTEVEQVSEDVVRARVVDPTGAFVVYAGQYQPEALAALESADTPSFVAVTGKARTFQPEDADVVYTSIRPEEVSEVDAETRDRWVVSTAEQTVDRVATMAAAHERVERGENLREILEGAGVQHGLAAGIPLALDHYGTTPAYLDAIRTLSLDAARVVAGERDEVGDLTLSPSDEGDADLGFAVDLRVDSESTDEDAQAAETTETETESEPAESDEASEAGTVDADFGEGDEETEVETAPAVSETEGESDGEAEAESETEPEPGTEPEPETEESVEASGPAAEPESEPASATGPAAETPEPDEVAAEAAPEEGEAAADGEMYELSEEEREEVKENYDVGFSTGSEVPDAGESDIDVPESDEEATAEDEATEEAADEEDLGDFDADDEAFDESQEDADDLDDFTEDEYDEPESDSEDSEAGAMDLDLEDYVVELMDELDDGDGALRENVVATAADERDADEGEIEDAIQEALMSGRCYESGDNHLKAI